MQHVAVDWISDACAAKTANVFSVPRGVELFLPDVVVPSPHYICAPNVGGKVSFRVEGTGRAVRVGAW